MAAIQNLCQTGILLTHGRLERAGPVSDVVKHYLTESNRMAELSFEDRTDREGSGALRFTGVVLKDENDRKVRTFNCGCPAVLELMISNRNNRNLRAVRIGVGVDNDLGQRVVVFSTHLAHRDFSELPADVESVEVRIPRMALAPGRYGFTLFASVNGEIADWIRNAGTFDVESGDFYGTGQMPVQGQGSFVMEHQVCFGALTTLLENKQTTSEPVAPAFSLNQ